MYWNKQREQSITCYEITTMTNARPNIQVFKRIGPVSTMHVCLCIEVIYYICAAYVNYVNIRHSFSTLIVNKWCCDTSAECYIPLYMGKVRQ